MRSQFSFVSATFLSRHILTLELSINQLILIFFVVTHDTYKCKLSNTDDRLCQPDVTAFSPFMGTRFYSYDLLRRYMGICAVIHPEYIPKNRIASLQERDVFIALLNNAKVFLREMDKFTLPPEMCASSCFPRSVAFDIVSLWYLSSLVGVQ